MFSGKNVVNMKLGGMAQGVPETRQTMLFSATMPAWVKSLTRKHLKTPTLVDLVGDAESGRINESIKCAPCASTLHPDSVMMIVKKPMLVDHLGDAESWRINEASALPAPAHLTVNPEP